MSIGWPRPQSLRTPPVSTTAPSSDVAAYMYADLTTVQSLWSNDGFSIVAYCRANSHQPVRPYMSLAGFSTAPVKGAGYIGMGVTIGAAVGSAGGLFTSADSGVYFGRAWFTESGSGTPWTTQGGTANEIFKFDESHCVVHVANSLLCTTDGRSYHTHQCYVDGALHLDSYSNATTPIYNPRSLYFTANVHGQLNGVDLTAVGIITGPISSLDAVYISRHTLEDFARISSHQVWAWRFDHESNRYKETTGKSPYGSYDMFRNTAVNTPFTLSDKSHFYPDYFVRLHDTSSDGQAVVNSSTDVNLTPFAGHVSVIREAANMFARPSAGQATVLLKNVSSGYTPWTQTKLREDNNLSVSAFYGGSLHVLFSGYIRDIKTDRHPGGHLDVTINALDSINFFRREYITERYRANTYVSSFLTDVISAGVKRTYSSITAVGRAIPVIWTRDERSIDELLGRAGTFYNPWSWLGYRVNSQAGSLSFINVLRVEPHSYAISGTSVESIDAFYSIASRSDTENIINRLNIRIFPRESSLSQVTSGAGLDLPLQIPANTTRNLWFYHADAEHNEWEGIPGEVQSSFVNSTHYVFNTASDGSGLNASAHLTITATSYGVKGFYQLQNTSANTDAWLVRFVTQPRVFKKRGEGLAQSVSSTSQVSYGLREMSISDNIWHQVDADTSSFAHYLVTRYKAPVPKIEATLRQYPFCFFNVGALVSVVDTISNVNGQYILTSVDHDINMGRGKEHTLRLRGEHHE